MGNGHGFWNIMTKWTMDMDLEISWYGWTKDMDACISYLIIGFVFSKGAVCATPDYGLWCWVEGEAFGGSQGVLGVSGDVWVWCLVSGVWCLVSGEVWVRENSPSPFFSLAISAKPCWAHWYNLPLILLALIIMGMGYCDLTFEATAQNGILGVCKFWKFRKRNFTEIIDGAINWHKQL